MKSFLSVRHRVASPGRPALSADSASALSRMSHKDNGDCERPASGKGTSAQVECVREGDRISRIVVTCGCGERIEIDCLYAAGNA